jgi:hypothetical protein
MNKILIVGLLMLIVSLGCAGGEKVMEEVGEAETTEASEPTQPDVQQQTSTPTQTLKAEEKVTQREEVETYENDKFGFSFEYPAGMEIRKEEFEDFSGDGNVDSGTVILRNDEYFIRVEWIDDLDRDVDMGLLDRMLGSHFTFTVEPEGDIFVGERKYSEHESHDVLEQRYALVRMGSTQVYAYLNYLGTWYCSDTNKIFRITARMKWEDPPLHDIIMSQEKTPSEKRVDMPDLEADPSYEAYEKLISSFRCHEIKR